MKTILLLFLTALLTLALTGCQSTPPPSTPTSLNPASVAGSDSAQIVYDLSQKTWCTNDEACSLILHLIDGQDQNKTFDERITMLKSKKVIPAHWNLPADEPVTKGTAAFMICKALHIEGGLFMHLVPSRRYAYREALYLELMQKGSEYEPLTGPEFVGIIGRAGRLEQKQP